MGDFNILSLFIFNFEIMKRFIRHTACFSALTLVVLLICEGIYYYGAIYQSKVDGWEVYAALKQSRKKQSKKKLLLGDSVAMQLYPCDKEHDSIVSLACNQAISLAGYYFLLTNYIETNRESLPEEVILLLNPLTLSNNLDQFAYHYFLKPFYNEDYKPHFTSYLSLRCRQIPFYWTAQLPFIRSSSYSFSYELPIESYALLSPISYDYLQLMIDVCASLQIDFKMCSVPINVSQETIIENKLGLENLDRETKYYDVLKAYISSFRYIPSENFIDKVHLTSETLQHIDKNELLLQ